MEPQQRLLLELGYEALHGAGGRRATALGGRRRVRGPRAAGLGAAAGSVGGVGSVSMYAVTGDNVSIAAGRLQVCARAAGPMRDVDTACSSALVALHSARLRCAAPRAPALAAAASLKLLPHLTSCATAGCSRWTGGARHLTRARNNVRAVGGRGSASAAAAAVVGACTGEPRGRGWQRGAPGRAERESDGAERLGAARAAAGGACFGGGGRGGAWARARGGAWHGDAARRPDGGGGARGGGRRRRRGVGAGWRGEGERGACGGGVGAARAAAGGGRARAGVRVGERTVARSEPAGGGARARSAARGARAVRAACSGAAAGDGGMCGGVSSFGFCGTIAHARLRGRRFCHATRGHRRWRPARIVLWRRSYPWIVPDAASPRRSKDFSLGLYSLFWRDAAASHDAVSGDWLLSGKSDSVAFAALAAAVRAAGGRGDSAALPARRPGRT